MVAEWPQPRIVVKKPVLNSVKYYIFDGFILNCDWKLADDIKFVFEQKSNIFQKEVLIVSTSIDCVLPSASCNHDQSLNMWYLNILHGAI